jgi:hypothetical protein
MTTRLIRSLRRGRGCAAFTIPSDPFNALAHLDRLCAGVPTLGGAFPDRFIPAMPTSSKTSSKLYTSVVSQLCRFKLIYREFTNYSFVEQEAKWADSDPRLQFQLRQQQRLRRLGVRNGHQNGHQFSNP